MGGFFRDIVDNWHVYATMPVIAALIGYITRSSAPSTPRPASPSRSWSPPSAPAATRR